ncbi:unnamed protein product [Soboliphyme baturini]|uniref:Transcription initiation factor TFIID subunit 13 n=1 Tax=Soboliphyme baturini TaxID=241478 RepID=A0A183IZ12_9BILA|nr:unnamed protein product [Soboliphyme baturini]
MAAPDDDIQEFEDEEEVAMEGTPSTAAGNADLNRKHYFVKELRCMLYGFGDSRVPYTETVNLLEEIVLFFLRTFTIRAMENGRPGKILLQDIWYLIRRDARKYARVKDLLLMNEELRRARKAFDEAKY